MEPPRLTINPNGEAKIYSGKVTSTSTDIITVEIWKLSFSVHKMVDTKVKGGKAELQFGEIQINDIVDVMGRVDETQAAFVHASTIHDRTQVKRQYDQEIAHVRKQIDELTARLNALLARAQTPTPTPAPAPVPTPAPTPPTPTPSSGQ